MKIALELTSLEANVLLRLIAVGNAQTFDVEKKDRMAGTWIANRILDLLSEAPASLQRTKIDRVKQFQAGGVLEISDDR